MQVKYLLNKDIDYQKWNDCIGRSVNGMVYAYTWYLDIVSPNWDALILGDYKVVMPLTWRKKYTFKYLYQPLWVQQLGVFSCQPLSSQLIQEFIAAIPNSFSYAEYALNEGNYFPIKKTTCCQHRPNYVLCLNASYEEIYRNFNTNTKRNIKKAQKAQLLVRQIKDVDALVRFYKQTTGMKLGDAINKVNYDEINKIVHFAIENGYGELIGVYTTNEEPVAIAFFMHSHTRIYNLLPATLPKGRTNGAMFFLLNFLITKYANSPFTLDFEGSTNKQVANFYRGFGAKEVAYPFITINKLPPFVKWLKK